MVQFSMLTLLNQVSLLVNLTWHSFTSLQQLESFCLSIRHLSDKLNFEKDEDLQNRKHQYK